MPFELLVALRFLREQRLQTILILLGIGVGVGVIIFLSALITGLQVSIIERTLGSQAQVFVTPQEEAPRVHSLPAGVLQAVTVERPPQRVRSIDGWTDVVGALRGTRGITGIAPTVSGPAIAVRGQGSIALSVRGIEPTSYRAIVDVDDRLVEGDLDLTGFRAVVGTELARKLGVEVGGTIRIQTAGDRGGTYSISGIFDYGSVTLNESLVFVSLRGAQTLFGLEGGVSALEITTDEIFEADALAARIRDRTGLPTESWIEQNGDLLVGLRSQSMSSIMIQVFVILAVALGIASVLAVSVVQKSREIGILRATGTQTRSVTRIFLIQGAVLGSVGSLVGIGLGTFLALFFARLATNPDGSALFPVALTAVLYGRSVAVALIVGLLAAVLPAYNASRMDPATVIRNG
ncbi:MAG: ABC transporter permease [Gemmatimonadetes bacterium]|nr:ABC transporter permease [Gemmatimonadota bacterium]MBT8462529.1 ABC transporter permease [Gemmatimonadota bacterium]NNK63612.1 ABC transporter permease [Gemmatimonadota bacterium]